MDGGKVVRHRNNFVEKMKRVAVIDGLNDYLRSRSKFFYFAKGPSCGSSKKLLDGGL